MIIGHVAQLPIVAFVDHIAMTEINPLYVFGTALDPWQHLAEWRSHRLRIDRSTSNFGQERMKDHMVFMVKKNDLTSVT